LDYWTFVAFAVAQASENLVIIVAAVERVVLRLALLWWRLRGARRIIAAPPIKARRRDRPTRAAPPAAPSPSRPSPSARSRTR